MSGTGPERPEDPEPSGTRDVRPLPRGCNPLVVGVAMATIEMGVLLWVLYC